MSKDITFKELKKSGYKDQTINQEIQANLIARIKANQPVFEGLYGYEDTVVPQLKKAIKVKAKIIRAKPLPPISLKKGPVPIYPPNKKVKDFFNKIGTTVKITLPKN